MIGYFLVESNWVGRNIRPYRSVLPSCSHEKIRRPSGDQFGDPSRTIIYSTNPLTASGDTTRSDFILTQLTTGSYRYSPQTGIGTTGAPFTGSLLSFTKQVISAQGEAASSAKQLADGQDVVLNTLKNKMSATSGVNIDEEMAHLLALQNAYSANARVMSTVKDMYTALLQAM